MSSGLRKYFLFNKDLPAVSQINNGEYGYMVRYRIISEDKNRFSSWTPIYKVPISLPDLSNGGISLNNQIVQLAWEKNNQINLYDVFTGFGFKINHKELLDNIATMTTENPHNLVPGVAVTITETDDPFNGTFIISEVPSPTSFSFSLVAANVAYHPTHGIARSYYYQATTSNTEITFLKNSNALDVKAIVQFASFEKNIADAIKIFESDSLSLV